jgi:hypothetical protein
VAWARASRCCAALASFPRREGEQVLPFTDQPPAPPKPGFNLLEWEELDSWITPNPKFVVVSHYNEPSLAEDDWRLEVTGLVERLATYRLTDLKGRSRSEVVFTVECGGNHGLPWLTGATRFMGRFMARDYVTLREEERGGETVGVETSVGPARLKSAPAKGTVKDGNHRIYGAAWGAPISKVEVRIDQGPWREAAIDPTDDAPYAWRLWTLDWPSPTPGEHAITSRAIDRGGTLQAAPTDPVIARKKTYWESFGWVIRRIRIA